MATNIAIFASGSGSNAENIAHYFKCNENVKISLIISNREDSFVLQRAKQLQIPAVVLSKQEMEFSSEHVLGLLKEKKIDFIVLAGYLLKIPSYLIAHYPRAIINIHPALLPKYGGKGMYGDRVHQAVVAAGETESGITIHYVNEHYDEGQIIFQAHCPVLPSDNYEAVAAKVHALEYEHFPRVIGEEAMKNR